MKWWKPKRRRRDRRECFGELVQTDGSIHDWLEGRGPRMTLLVLIDDATSKVVARFYPAETTDGYFRLLKRYLRKHGRMAAIYADRNSIFFATDNDAHRPLGRSLDLKAILSTQDKRKVANDYTIRFNNTMYQLLPPALPGLCRTSDHRALGSHSCGALSARR